MSWFIGYTGINNPVLNEYISSLNLIQKEEINNPNLHLFYTRKKNNLMLNIKTASGGWIISGIPVSAGSDNLKFMQTDDWEPILSAGELNIKKINGHFTGMIWDNETFTFFNDPLGLRDVYFLKVNSNYFFSTRPGWIAKFNAENKINISEFSTNWNLPHQISWGSILNNIMMLNPGGIIKIKSGVIEKSNSPWMPDFSRVINSEEFIDALNNFIRLPSFENKKINLGLSGGIDSRVLLQILFNNKIDSFGSHTFGSSFTADGKIAEKIVNNYELEHRFFPVSFPDSEELLKYLYDSISQLGLSASIYEILNYPFYEQLGNEEYIIIDGAYGEIFRRAYLNRFLILGKNALLNKDAESIFRLLRRSKSDIFNNELIKQIEISAVDRISDILQFLPDVDSIGIENWLDTFFIKTKVANISGPSQTLLDGTCRAFMPFIQPFILDKGFGLDFSEKKNGKLFWRIINQGKELNRYPLVKDQIIYPFSSNLLLARLYQKFKRKVGLIHKDNYQHELLMRLKEFVLDRVNSQEVKNFDLYDYKKVSNLVADFYNGNTSMINSVTWWITFDIWRECCKIK